MSDDAKVAGMLAAVCVALALSLAWSHPEQAPAHDVTTPTTTHPVIFQP